MKKILVLNYEFPPLGGGASPVSYEIAKRLSETGDFDIDVVTMKYRGLAAYEEVNPHFRIHRVKCLRSKKEICHPWEQLSYLFSAWFKCKKLLKQNTYDICHTHFIIPTGVIALMLKKKFGLEYVITSHGSDVPGFNTDRFQLLHKFTGPFLRKICRESKHIISPSKYLKDLILSNISKELEDKIVVIPNGIDTNKFTPQEKKKYIFSSGRLLPRKGFQYLVQAVSEEDIGYEVHIAGDGPMMSELKQLAEKSKTKIVFHGWLNNNGKEYKDLVEQSAIFVLASESESFGMVIAEAMSAGCAIITTNTSGCAEVAEGGGLFVNMKDREDLKSKLKFLLSDSYKREEYQKMAFVRSKNYDWSTILKQNMDTLSKKNTNTKKVLLVGSYHGNNKGDETIFLTFLKEIKTLYGGLQSLTVGTKNPAYFRNKYFINAITPFQIIFSIFKYDLVILGGGGLIFDYSLIDTIQIVKKSQILYWLIISYLAKLLGKQVIWLAVGVGPVTTKLAQKLIPFVVNKLDYISVRDNESYLLMKKLGVTSLEETRDIVFGFEDASIVNIQSDMLVKEYVLVIPRLWEDKESESYNLFRDIIEHLLRLGKNVVLTETNYIKDRTLNKKLEENFKINPSFKYKPLLPESDINDFLELIKNSCYLISMRMHPIIIASLYDIPAIAIEYKTPKIYSVMKNLHIEDLCISLDTFDISCIEIMEKEYSEKKKAVHDGCNSMKDLNKKNISALQKFL